MGWLLLSRIKFSDRRRRQDSGSQHRIAVLRKTGGMEDILAAVAHANGTITVIELPRDAIKQVFDAFMPADLDDFNYRPDDATLQPAKDRYRAFIGKICRWYARAARIDAFVAASFGYYAEREMAGACEAAGLPFVVLHKESIRSPGQRPLYEDGLRTNVGRFTGSSIAVYNAEEGQSLAKAGITDNATVIGCPRADTAHKVRLATIGSPERSILYYAIDATAGTRSFGPSTGTAANGQGEPPRWTQLIELTEAQLVDFARRHPDFRVTVKAKLGRGGDVKQRLARLSPPDNMTVVTGGTGTSFLKTAHTVIGLNTTALLEAIAAGRHVITPAYAEAARDDAATFLFELGDAVCRATDPQQLENLLLDLSGQPTLSTLPQTHQDVLERYLGNADGEAGLRAYQWLAGQFR